MKVTHVLSLLFQAALLTAISSSAQAQLAYRLQAIIDPSSANYVYPSGLNNRGEVIGSAETIGVRGFHWKDGVFTDLQTATGSAAAVMSPAGINDRSVIVGTQDINPRNFRIRDNQLHRVQVSTADGTPSIIGVNNRNQIVGRGQTTVFVWERGTTTFLPRLPGSDEFVTAPNGINDRGVVVGISGSIDLRRAVIWKDGNVIALDLPPDTTHSEGVAINNFDQVVGNAYASGVIVPFMWNAGTTTALPLPPGAIAANVWSINDWGVISGASTMSAGGAVHAALWISGQGYDLNTLVDANDPLSDEIILTQAFYINERGQIVAYGSHRTTGANAAYLLTPTYRAPAIAE